MLSTICLSKLINTRGLGKGYEETTRTVYSRKIKVGCYIVFNIFIGFKDKKIKCTEEERGGIIALIRRKLCLQQR